MPRCRFGDDEAIARFRLDRGCVAYPDDREQDLCLHHYYKATPLGSFEIIRNYTDLSDERLVRALTKVGGT